MYIIDIFLDYMPRVQQHHTHYTLHGAWNHLSAKTSQSIPSYWFSFFIHFDLANRIEYTKCTFIVSNLNKFSTISWNFTEFLFKNIKTNRNSMIEQKKNVVFMVFFFLFGMVSCLLLIYEFRSLFDVFIKPTTTTHYKHLHFGRICSAYCILGTLWVYGCVHVYRFGSLFVHLRTQNKYMYVTIYNVQLQIKQNLHSQNSNGWALMCLCLLHSDRNDDVWHSVMATQQKLNLILSCVV